MKLQEVQETFCNIIKSRKVPEDLNDEYFARISASGNLQLVKKIVESWRTIQIVQFSVLTCNYLRSIDMLQRHIDGFIRTVNFSSFRNEVGFQFLDYLINIGADDITVSLAELELNLIRQMLGKEVYYSKIWHINPYEFIDLLIKNSFTNSFILENCDYKITISPEFKDELFSVEKMEK